MNRRTILRGAVLLGVGATTGGLWAEQAFAVTAPTIAGCDTWGARQPNSALTQLTTNPNKILIHHVDSPNTTDYSLSHAYDLARSIQADHMDNNGWADTGQHFTLSRGGYAMEGRHTSLSHLQSGSGMVQGAHCPGQNTQAIGIEHEGTYMTVTPPPALWNASVDLCAYICSQYKIPVTEIYGHRDFLATDCPGDAFYAQLPDLRNAVAAKLAAWSTIVDNTSSGFRASANWSTSTLETSRYGADYRYATPVAASDPAYYSATLPTTGNYRIEAWWPNGTQHNTATPYVVFASGGNQSVVVNQQVGGGGWYSLGTFAFAAGTRDVVAVSRWTSGTQFVIADAVRITKV